MRSRRRLRPPRAPRRDGTGRHRARPCTEERISHYTAAGAAALVVSASTYTMISDALTPEVPIPTFAPGPQQLALPPDDSPVPPVPPTRTTPLRRPHDARTTPVVPSTAPARAPAEPLSAPPEPPAECTIDNQWGDVKPRVRQVACLLDERFPGVDSMLGVAKRGLAGSGHPRGLAVDVVVNDDRVTGDAIAACAAAHFTDWDLDYVLWRQASLEEAGGEFERMADRGGRTANHYDHVHLSFHNSSEPIPDEALTCDDGGEAGL